MIYDFSGGRFYYSVDHNYIVHMLLSSDKNLQTSLPVDELQQLKRSKNMNILQETCFSLI